MKPASSCSVHFYCHRKINTVSIQCLCTDPKNARRVKFPPVLGASESSMLSRWLQYRREGVSAAALIMALF